MIWGYHCFRKHPYVTLFFCGMKIAVTSGISFRCKLICALRRLAGKRSRKMRRTSSGSCFSPSAGWWYSRFPENGGAKKTVKQSNSYFPIPCLFTYFKNQHFKVGRNSWRVSLDLQVWHVLSRGDHGWTTSYSRGKMWSSDSVLQMLWSIHGLKILRLKAQNLGC